MRGSQQVARAGSGQAGLYPGWWSFWGLRDARGPGLQPAGQPVGRLAEQGAGCPAGGDHDGGRWWLSR